VVDILNADGCPQRLGLSGMLQLYTKNTDLDYLHAKVGQVELLIFGF
jgi:hypothetical protein